MPSGIYQHKKGGPKRKRSPKFVNGEEIEIVNLYKGGFSMIEIGKIYDREKGTISNILKRQNVPVHGLQVLPLNIKLTEGEKGYIAGIIDGEGWLGKTKGNTLRLTIANTDKKIMQFLKKKLPNGKIYRRSAYLNKSKNSLYKTCYHFDVGKTFIVYQLLKEIVFYMIIKKEKAEKYIGYLDKFFN